MNLLLLIGLAGLGAVIVTVAGNWAWQEGQLWLTVPVALMGAAITAGAVWEVIA